MVKKLALVLPLLCVMAAPVLAATVRVKADNTPLRMSPAPTGAVLGELKAGTVLDLVDVDRDWYRVRDPRTKVEGYVQASAVELQPGSGPVVPGQKPASPGAARPPQPSGRRPARAPQKGDWTDRAYFSANALYQAGAPAVTQSQAWPYFGETATAAIRFPARGAWGVEASGGYRIWRNLAVGAGVSVASQSVTAVVSGSIPHPLYVGQARTISGGFSASRTEVGLHLQAAWAILLTPKMTLMVFGGPAIFNVTHTVVSDKGLQFPSVYPYDTPLQLSGAVTTDASTTAIGFGGGADFAYYFTKTIGVGGMVRLTRAPASFGVSNQPAFEVTAGGVQAGGGLRIRFGPPKPGKPRPKPPAPPKK